MSGNVNDRQPSLRKSEWNMVMRDESTVRISPTRNGQSIVNALNSFYELNNCIFEDSDGVKFTEQDAQNLHEKLVEIHQRRGDNIDIDKITMKDHIYYTKKELTELAEAAGYKVKGSAKKSPQPKEKAEPPVVQEQKPKPQPKVIEPEPKDEGIALNLNQAQAANITNDSNESAPNMVLKPIDVPVPQPEIKNVPSEDTADSNANKPIKINGEEVTYTLPTQYVPANQSDDTPVVPFAAPEKVKSSVNNNQSVAGSNPTDQKKTLTDLYKNLNVSGMTKAQFREECKRIEESDEFKKLDFSAPEKTAYFDWVRVNGEQLSDIDTGLEIPESLNEQYKSSGKVLDDTATTLPKAFLARQGLTVEQYNAKSDAEKAELKAKYEKEFSEVIEDVAVDEKDPAVSDATTGDKPPAQQQSPVQPVSTNPVSEKPQTKFQKLNIKTGYDELKFDDFIKIGKESIKAMDNVAIEKFLKYTKSLSPDDFAKTFEFKDAKTLSSQLGVTEAEFVDFVKTMDEDGLAFFFGFKLYSKRDDMAAAAENTQTQQAKPVASKKPVKPAKVATSTTQVKPQPAPEAQSKPIIELNADQITEFIGSRADFKGKSDLEISHILRDELKELEKDPNADPSEVDKYYRTMAYLNISTISPINVQSKEGIITYRFNVKVIDGKKVAIKAPDGKLNGDDGHYGFKFRKREGYEHEYEAVIDMDNRLASPVGGIAPAVVASTASTTSTATTTPAKDAKQDDNKPDIKKFAGTPQGIASYVASRADLKDKEFIFQKQIILKEIKELKQDPKADPDEIDKLQKAYAYCTLWNGHEEGGIGGTPTYDKIIDKNGNKYVAKCQQGTYKRIGYYGVKFVPDKIEKGAYILEPDWNNPISIK